ncbi:MAG TPA: alginate export family protein [Bryobacteraceae bacterium]|jgi:hypothetical protein
MRLLRGVLSALLLCAGFPFGSESQALLDPAVEGNQRLTSLTDGILHLTFEERTRWEERYGVNFGEAPNQQDMLSRLRFGADIRPASWLKITLTGQDARAPFYGPNAPGSMRDTADLQESYIELFPKAKSGFGAIFGREMLDFGESRVIGTPQWSNTARTYDGGRVSYRKGPLRMEALLLSPVVVQPDAFNGPEFGNHIWGTYNVISQFWKGLSIDAYALRHSQNKSGGFSGEGTLGTNTFGARLYGPLPWAMTYDLEGIGQGGHIGPKTQRAYAWFAGATKATKLWEMPLIFSAEYKLASGSRADSHNSGTYDQISPANHDKFGHEDLFGWRNLKTFRSLETLHWTKAFALNVMYSDEHLVSATDALYNSSGAAIAKSETGTAGTHVGQELDAFLTYKCGHHTFGAGFGHFFAGEFVRATTPGVNPRYFYVFQQYTIK